MAGGMGGSKESAPGKNPFEILKEVIENNNNSKGGGYDTNKPEETAQTKETTKLIFPSDIEGAEEIYEDPKLERFENYGDTKLYYLENGEYKEYSAHHLSSDDIKRYIVNLVPNSKILDIEKSCSGSGYSGTPTRNTMQCGSDEKVFANDGFKKTPHIVKGKCSTYKTGGGYDPAAEESIEKALEQPSQSAEGYKTNTYYKFIKKIDKSVIFAKDSEQLDHKIYPKLNGIGELTINLDASHSAKKYFETPIYATFSASANDSCVTRSIDNYWYDPNELKLIKEQPESKIQNTEENKIAPVDDIAITFDGVSDSYYDGYNLHERLIASSLNNSEIKVFCSSCIEQKDYSVKIDIDSYKKMHAENVKKQEKIKFDQTVAPFKTQCEEIGFKPGTDKFKNCLVEMMN
jgi:hypothetical protein